MYLSNNFNLEEFLASDTAKIRNIKNEIENSEHLNNLADLCVNCLQPIRDKFGRVTITSGYRCAELNGAVGGKVNSQHQIGCASDCVCGGAKLREVYKWCVNNLTFDQLILYPTFLHISYVNGKNRQQSFIK